MPIGKYIEKYGLGVFEQSLYAIEEVTKRNTGEYAIRPFIRMYPEKCLEVITRWAKSENRNTQWIIKRASRKIDSRIGTGMVLTLITKLD